MEWKVVYESAVQDDGSLLFPERLTEAQLEHFKRSMGSYRFAQQYLNIITPEDDAKFQRSWLHYYDEIPAQVYTFAFIDPAISQEDHADYTALCVIDVDVEKRWYLRTAKRFKITPSEIVDLIFKTHAEFNCAGIGIEDVAYQRALLYMLDEESRRRNVVLPIKGIRPTPEQSKYLRIMGLVPRFEWNRIFINRGLEDFELEYLQFPNSAHDDIMDALAYLERIVYYPEKERPKDERPNPADAQAYERWYIRQLQKGQKPEPVDYGEDF